MLAHLTSGRISRIVRATPGQNGFVAWKSISREMDPRTAQRQLSMLAGLLKPNFGSGCDDFEERWMEWELEIGRYLITRPFACSKYNWGGDARGL